MALILSWFGIDLDLAWPWFGSHVALIQLRSGLSLGLTWPWFASWPGPNCSCFQTQTRPSNSQTEELWWMFKVLFEVSDTNEGGINYCIYWSNYSCTVLKKNKNRDKRYCMFAKVCQTILHLSSLPGISFTFFFPLGEYYDLENIINMAQYVSHCE